MAKNQKEAEPGRKESAYPYYPFSKSLRLAEAVKDYGGGRNDVEKDVLANELKMGEGSPSFAQVLASAKCFGMIEGRGTYRLTERSQRYFFPENDAESAKAKLEFFGQPGAFQVLVKRFDGNRLPDPGTLANILRRDGSVPKSWVSRVVSLFMDAAREMELIDSDGRLRYAVAMKRASRPESPEGRLPATAYSIEESSSTNPLSQEGVEPSRMAHSTNVVLDTLGPRQPLNPEEGNVWFFKEAGGTVRLETPDPLPRVLWERLKRYVEVLEPAKGEITQTTEKATGTQPVGE